MFLIENMFYISLVCLQPEVLFVSNRKCMLVFIEEVCARGSNILRWYVEWFKTVTNRRNYKSRKGEGVGAECMG